MEKSPQKENPNLVDVFWGSSKISSEIVTSFRTLIEGMRKLREAMNTDIGGAKKQMAEMEKSFKGFEKILNAKLLRLETEFSSDRVKAIKEDFSKSFMALSQEFEKEFIALKETVPTEIPPPQITEITNEITKTIESPETADDIRNKLEVLNGDERLDKSAIKGLDEEISKLWAGIGSAKANSSKGGVIRNRLRSYSLTSQCNGITKSFTVPIKTVAVMGVFGSQFPVQFDPINDWVFSGNTITLDSSVGAPLTGQTLWALIETI